MADIINPQEGSNPQVGLKNIFTKLKEIIRVLNTAVSNIAQNTLGISLLEDSLGPIPKIYKALISQNAPVVTTQTPTILAGQIWEDTIGTADAADLIVLGGYELMSGTLGAVNATYRSFSDDTPSFNTSSFAYDGSPYVVSKDGDGLFNPFFNSLSGAPVFSYDGVGEFYATLANEFTANKTLVIIGAAEGGYMIGGSRYSDDAIYISKTIDDSTTYSNGFANVSILIEVYA